MDEDRWWERVAFLWGGGNGRERELTPTKYREKKEDEEDEEEEEESYGSTLGEAPEVPPVDWEEEEEKRSRVDKEEGTSRENLPVEQAISYNELDQGSPVEEQTNESRDPQRTAKEDEGSRLEDPDEESQAAGQKEEVSPRRSSPVEQETRYEKFPRQGEQTTYTRELLQKTLAEGQGSTPEPPCRSVAEELSSTDNYPRRHLVERRSYQDEPMYKRPWRYFEEYQLDTDASSSSSSSAGRRRSSGVWRKLKSWAGDVKRSSATSGNHLLKASALSLPSLDYHGQAQPSGFEELRKYIKQGGDFCKDLAAVLHERSEAEVQYAKTLAKLSVKLVKATREQGVTSVNTCWHRIALEMEAQAEAHRMFGGALSEDVVKPLRQLLETQHRIRKSVETAVDKSGKSLAEWRNAESKAKKQSFSCARENEKLRDGNQEQRNRLSASSLHLHRHNADKEQAKLEGKRRKAEECFRKADVDYYNVSSRAERARLEWESAIKRGSQCFQVLEEERLRGLKDLASTYLSSFNIIGPKLTEIGGRLCEPVGSCDVSRDCEMVNSLGESCNSAQEQQLPDFYAEHLTLAMNQERRLQALVKLLTLVRQDIEREKRGKSGVENLARALGQTPNFATDDTRLNVSEKLHHMRSMLAFLEGVRYKLSLAMSQVEGRSQSTTHPLAEHIEVARDRHGLLQSTLKVPGWVHKEVLDEVDWIERGTADGNSVQPDSDFDEFSSEGGSSGGGELNGGERLRCKALYNYTANLYDELSLNPGDIISIHDKQPDGWWLGELNGVVGIFPATYVEEIK